MLHPIPHKEEGKGNHQYHGEGTGGLEGREGWDTEQLGAQGSCAHARSSLTSSQGVPFASCEISHSWEKGWDAMM